MQGTQSQTHAVTLRVWFGFRMMNKVSLRPQLPIQHPIIHRFVQVSERNARHHVRHGMLVGGASIGAYSRSGDVHSVLFSLDSVLGNVIIIMKPWSSRRPKFHLGYAVWHRERGAFIFS